MNDELKTQWHPAFCAAMELILRQDRAHLEFIREYNLNTKPLEMDLLVIKKPAGYVVKDVIGRIFREHNIFEYKSPDDKMNIDTFYKVNAYAALYKASAHHVDEIGADNVTITMVRENKPEKLLHTLEETGFAVSSPCAGIYYIGGKSYFRTQIVASKELTGEQHVWLQALTRKLDRKKAGDLVSQTQGIREEGEKKLADAILTVSVKENRALFRAAKEEDERMFEVLKELMADEINAGIALGEARGEARGEALGEARGEARGKAQEKENGLKALVSVLKGMPMDFETAYRTVVQTEAYAGVSRQQVMKYWE